jgi:Protein of unknown function (DUF3800)
MWLAYFDESKENNKFFVYSALVVDSTKWNQAFDAVKRFRQDLKAKYGIYTKKELHAWKFAAGKGQISTRVLSKQQRAVIFREVLQFIAGLGGCGIISAVNTNEFYAFERIMNRINKTAERKKAQVMLLCDEGQEIEFTRRIRRMHVFNPIPSNRQVWTDGKPTKNIPISAFIEDPVFKQSHMSYFIQLTDFIAYALLRMERPIPSRTALGYDQMYPILKPRTTPLTNRADPRGLGIIR